MKIESPELSMWDAESGQKRRKERRIEKGLNG